MKFSTISAQTSPRWLAGWKGWPGALIHGAGLWAWMAIIAILIYRFAAPAQVIVGDYYDPPYLNGHFSAREAIAETNRPFRWTTGDATIEFPQVGRGAWVVKLGALTAHPDSSPVAARVSIGGHTIQLTDMPEPRVNHIFVPATATGSGTIKLDIASKLYNEPTASARTLGVALFGASTAPTGDRPLMPPLATLLLLGLLIWGVALTLRATGLPGLWASGVAAAIGAGFGLPLALARIPFTFWLPNLVVLSWVSLLIILVLRKVVPALCALGGVTVDGPTLTILLLVFLAGFWIKAGGQVYPYMIAIDIHWHMDRVRWILDGRLGEMYKPGAFNESVMPEREFGKNRPTIPYSPFFHIFATSFALLPWQMETTAKVFCSMIDLSYIFIIYFLARSFGLSRRSGLLAAGFYAVIPLTFLLQSWGNAPTTFGMWWTMISCAFIVGAWGRLRERKVFWTLTALLLTTFLMYTVMAVFMGMLLIIWMALIAFQRRDQRAQVWAVAKATGLGVLFSTLIYYGLYIPDIVRKTIPYFSQTLTEGQASVGAVQYQPTLFDNYLAYATRFWNNGLMIPLLMTPLLLWLFARRARHEPTESRQWLGTIWMCAMIIVSLIFVPIDRSVPMVDKHVIFLLPVWSILIGMYFDLALRDTRWVAALPAFWLTVIIGNQLLGSPLATGWFVVALAVPILALAAGWAQKTLLRREYWPAVAIAVCYLVMFAASIELWVRRISTVKQVW